MQSCVFQVGGHFRRAALREIGRRGADHPLQVGDLALDEGAFRDVARAHGDIGVLLDQVDQTVGDRQFEVDFRVAGEEIGQGRGQLVQAEGGAGIDVQPAARSATYARYLLLGLLDIGDDPLGAGKKRFAFGG